MTRFVIVPQWQGSPSTRAMLLADGAEAIAGDLPRSACTRVEVPTEAGEALGTGIRRFSTLSRLQARIAEALEGTDERIVVVGGDGGVAVPSVAHAATRHRGLTVVWFDAHAGLHTPETSPSGAFAGMALRAIRGDGPLAAAVPVERVVLAGARAFDDAEVDAVETLGIRTVSCTDLTDPAALVEAAGGEGPVYVHVGLDVLDPAAITGVTGPVPFGLDVRTLTTAIAAVRARMPLVGASLSGFAPATPVAAVDDLGAILRVIGALA